MLAQAIAPARAPAGAIALPPRPHIRAVRTPTPPKIDGHLDDLVWRAAIPSDAFTQHYPDEGARPQRAHRGARPLRRQEPLRRHRLRSKSTRRSSGGCSGATARSPPTASGSTSTAAATASAPTTSRSTPPASCSTRIHYNDTGYSADWDAIWEAKVATTAHGYSAEYRIPLSSLRFTARPVQSWGFRGAARHRRAPGDRRLGLLPAPRRPASSPTSAASTISSACRRRAGSSCARSCSASSSTGPPAPTPTHRAGHLRARLCRARRQGAPHQRADARPDGEPRLRPGRRRHRHPEPLDVRDVLPRKAAVLPGGARRLRHHPPRPLHPPHRPPAGAADAERRRAAVARARSLHHLRRRQGLGHDRRQDHRGRDVGGDRRERRRWCRRPTARGSVGWSIRRPRSTSCG